MILRLMRADLHFIAIGTGGKVHAQQHTAALCGKVIPASERVMEARAIPVARLCGRCYASLRTYTRTRTPGIRIEREVGE